MYRYLALDLDGTLLTSKKEITNNTLQLLWEIQNKGIKLILCTGRPTYGVWPIAELLKMQKHQGKLITFNGGMTIDCETRGILDSHLISSDLLPIFYEYANKYKLTLMSYKENNIISENGEDPHVLYTARNNQMRSITVDNFLDVIKFPVPKCLVLGDPNRIVNLEKELNSVLRGKANAFRSEPFMLELVPAGVDKAKSLKQLISSMESNSCELVACGDGHNDTEMIKYAGLGVAMGNAQTPAKAVADYIAPSNDEDGIADVIRRFLL